MISLKAKYAAEQAAMESETQFSVSQQEQTAKGATIENASDIKVFLGEKIKNKLTHTFFTYLFLN